MKKLLLIDDEPGIYSVLCALIPEYKDQIIYFSDIEKGIESLYNINNIALVLLDVMLPPKRGIDYIPLFTEKGIAVILISALDDMRMAVEAIKKGAIDYVVKPFSRDRIFPMVKNYLSEDKD